jgi:hypothetical protein
MLKWRREGSLLRRRWTPYSTTISVYPTENQAKKKKETICTPSWESLSFEEVISTHLLAILMAAVQAMAMAMAMATATATMVEMELAMVLVTC